jgi:hypothetical protein
MTTDLRVELPMEAIADFCRRWKIIEFAVFGSALRDDFRPDSDIDVMVTFEPGARWGLFAQARMERELSETLGREVDLLRRDGVEEMANALRRDDILKSARLIYAQ